MKLSGFVGSLTPTAGVANFILEGTASTTVKVWEFELGGQASSSTPMQTRVSRDSAVGTGTRTAGNVQRIDVTTATPGNGAFFTTTYATTQPTIVAGALRGASWNAYGGIYRWLAAPNEEFALYGAASLECRADVGVGLSSYSVFWEEL